MCHGTWTFLMCFFHVCSGRVTSSHTVAVCWFPRETKVFQLLWILSELENCLVVFTHTAITWCTLCTPICCLHEMHHSCNSGVCCICHHFINCTRFASPQRLNQWAALCWQQFKKLWVWGKRHLHVLICHQSTHTTSSNYMALATHTWNTQLSKQPDCSVNTTIMSIECVSQQWWVDASVQWYYSFFTT